MELFCWETKEIKYLFLHLQGSAPPSPASSGPFDLKSVTGPLYFPNQLVCHLSARAVNRSPTLTLSEKDFSSVSSAFFSVWSWLHSSLSEPKVYSSVKSSARFATHFLRGFCVLKVVFAICFMLQNLYHILLFFSHDFSGVRVSSWS